MLQRNNVGSKRESKLESEVAKREEFLTLRPRSRVIARTRSQSAANVSLDGYASSCDGVFILYRSIAHERKRAANVRFRVQRFTGGFTAALGGRTQSRKQTTNLIGVAEDASAVSRFGSSTRMCKDAKAGKTIRFWNFESTREASLTPQINWGQQVKTRPLGYRGGGGDSMSTIVC